MNEMIMIQYARCAVKGFRGIALVCFGRLTASDTLRVAAGAGSGSGPVRPRGMKEERREFDSEWMSSPGRRGQAARKATSPLNHGNDYNDYLSPSPQLDRCASMSRSSPPSPLANLFFPPHHPRLTPRSVTDVHARKHVSGDPWIPHPLISGLQHHARPPVG
jgi:hypothetical protein